MIAKLITPAKSPLECKVTQSQVPKIKMWTSLRRHYTTYTPKDHFYLSHIHLHVSIVKGKMSCLFCFLEKQKFPHISL